MNLNGLQGRWDPDFDFESDELLVFRVSADQKFKLNSRFRININNRVFAESSFGESSCLDDQQKDSNLVKF